MIIASLIHALPPTARRCFDRKEAASYFGISTGTFDKLVRSGELPKPIEFLGRKVWDRVMLDRVLDRLSGAEREANGRKSQDEELDRELAEFEAKHGYDH